MGKTATSSFFIYFPPSQISNRCRSFILIEIIL